MTGSIELDRDGQHLLIRFPYNPLIVEDVKSIPGRRWDPPNKVWRVPVAQLDVVVAMFMRHGFLMSSDVTMLLAGTSKKGTPAAAEAPATNGKTTTTPPAGDSAPVVDALSISALNERVRTAIQGAFPQPLWVVGEVTDFDKNKDARHLFFTLVEKKPGDASIAARVQVALFEREAKRLLAKLGPGEMRDGIEVRVLVRVELYAAQGRYQLIVEDIDPSFTLGKLALERERILQELRAKGLDRKNASLALPVPPLRVGVLCSPDSDGWNDFLREIEASRIGFTITAYAVRVQGKEVRPTVLAGLRWFATRADQFDCVCILRGGGSRTDLAWFDDRDLALAVAHHPTKVLCGIGHQRDMSVLDLIAHSEKTPTALAVHLIRTVQQAAAELDDCARALVDAARGTLARSYQSLTRRGESLRRIVHGRLVGERRNAVHLTSRLRRAASAALERRTALLLRRRERLVLLARLRCERAGNDLARADLRLRLLDPRTVVARGYVVVRDANGRILPDMRAVAAGDALSLTFRDGMVRARVDRTET